MQLAYQFQGRTVKIQG